MPSSLTQSVTIIGAGVAGMSAACALAEAGLRVHLVDRRAYLGGRASSYLHPGVNEVIDNCQHVLFGCCTNLTGFYHRIGAADKIKWSADMTMIEPGGRRSTLGPTPLLPAPLHGLPRLLTAHAFTRDDKLSLARAFRAMLAARSARLHRDISALAYPPQSNPRRDRALLETRHRQRAQRRNRNHRRPYAAKVIRELFMNSAYAGRMGINTVPLSELYARVPALLAQSGGAVHLNSNVDSIEWDEQGLVLDRRHQIRPRHIGIPDPRAALRGHGQTAAAHAATDAADALAQLIAHHEHWPICSAHLWFDREITELDHAVLLDREIHWLFNRGKLQPWRKQQGSYIEIEVSASQAFAARERKQAIDLTSPRTRRILSRRPSAKLVKAALVKEVRATFGVPPGIDAARPTSHSPWPNCFLAGDWTATGWPSTMESASRSGHLAAEAICTTLGDSRKFLVPDLKPQGLMRLLG